MDQTASEIITVEYDDKEALEGLEAELVEKYGENILTELDNSENGDLVKRFGVIETTFLLAIATGAGTKIGEEIAEFCIDYVKKKTGKKPKVQKVDLDSK
ncbi:hypothetical protein [Haladaptatus sp. DFWS20]|uniref:hypothetical protein n=1 Tax=Haladaptatus sp. DFWS20 TaxID=3403467 RepID=UPI003EBE76FD